MDDARRYGLNPQFDIHQILLEAKTRWLRPSEICEILRNCVRFNITPDPPYKPPGGSLYLFDRKALRYFRKDGHHWRKKKDGKTVREAHEKLKSGSVDVLHCYYAHGEDNENFQRRSYWLLDGKLEHIVLVHYRDLKEGSHQLYSDPNLARVPTSLEICSTFASSNSSTEWKTQTSSEFEVGDSWDDFCGASQANTLSSSGFQVSSFLESGMAEEKVLVRTSSISHPYGGFLVNTEGFNKSVEPLSDQIISHNFMLGRGQNVHRVSDATVSFGDCQFSHHSTPSVWSEVHRFNQNHNEIKDRSIFFDHLSSTVVLKNKTADPIPDNYKKIKFEVDGDYQVQPDFHAQLCDGAVSAPVQIKEETITCDVPPFDDDHTLNSAVHGFKISNQNNSYGGHSDIIKPLDCKTKVSDALNSTLQRDAHDGVLGEFKKLNSFGRWMRKELVKDSDQTLIASNRNYWTTIAISSDEKEISSLYPDMQLEIDSLAPSVSQEQLFSIIDFSPDWTYSGGGTKVLISGTFLAEVPRGIHFCCMFGEVEVSSELLGSNTICCYAPPHVPGRVPFYLTSSNRLACSEIREFEYRENPSSSKLSSSQNVFEDELHLEIHFAKFLSLVSGNMVCSAENCYICSMKNKLYHMLIDETEWYNIENLRVYHEHHRNHRDVLLVNLLKGKLYEWLLYKAHEEGKGLNTLDERGRGIIHLAAALGYEWAMKPIVAAGISPSFRDSHGRTALHWAAYYGREETVSTLLKVGAFPGAVEDPTSKFPQGQTAADLASSRGHKGIAGYLAEADLTSHLFSMSSIDKALDSVSVAHAAEHIVETLEEKVQELASVEEGQISLRETLAAMRNSAQAAARIQAAFRIQSFRQRDNTYRAQKYELTEALMISSLNNNIQRANHFHSSHIAAIKIQQQYRGWKARREFLKIRDRIVRIQAHVRGHQARKQYKKIIWSVSIVEKVILRWRRKGSGLRGFRNEGVTFGHDQDEEKIDEYEFLRLGRKQKVVGIEKALSRVKSMVRCPAARDQYMRLISSSNKSNLQLGVEKSSLDRS